MPYGGFPTYHFRISFTRRKVRNKTAEKFGIKWLKSSEWFAYIAENY